MSPADLLVVGTTVRTLDPARPTANAVAVAGDRIVGLDGDALALRGPRTEVVDLGGAVTVLGLVDGHMHPLFGAATFYGADLTGCATSTTCVPPSRPPRPGRRDGSSAGGSTTTCSGGRR